MSKTIIKIGPADHGRPMELDDFAESEAEEGPLHELGRGIITVVEIPKNRNGGPYTEPPILKARAIR